MALWVFGYGSLLWDPGFNPAETQPARLDGFARTFCMRSIHHRGTRAEPGLVLALDAQAGAFCDGLAYRVSAGEEDAVTRYLRERELVSSAYLEVEAPVRLAGGGPVPARVFVVDPAHAQYCGGLPLEEQARIIAHATGGRGPNHEYLGRTATELERLGIADEGLRWLDRRVRVLRAHSAQSAR